MFQDFKDTLLTSVTQFTWEHNTSSSLDYFKTTDAGVPVEVYSNDEIYVGGDNIGKQAGLYKAIKEWENNKKQKQTEKNVNTVLGYIQKRNIWS